MHRSAEDGGAHREAQPCAPGRDGYGLAVTVRAPHACDATWPTFDSLRPAATNQLVRCGVQSIPALANGAMGIRDLQLPCRRSYSCRSAIGNRYVSCIATSPLLRHRCIEQSLDL